MPNAKYGIFVHYQYRILLGNSVATKPQFPEPWQMTNGSSPPISLGEFTPIGIQASAAES